MYPSKQKQEIGNKRYMDVNMSLLFALTLFAGINSSVIAEQTNPCLIREYFDKQDAIRVIKSSSCSDVSSRIIREGVFGGGSLVINWSGKNCLIIARKRLAKPYDFDGKMFRLHYKVLSGKWELPAPVKIGFNFGRDNMYVVGEDRVHGFIAVTLYDVDGKMVEMHLWRSWWWHSKPGKWTWIYMTTGRPADRGGVYTYQKGKGDIHRVTRIDFCASQAPGISGKAGILWDGFEEMKNKLEYITPNLQRLLVEKQAWREDDNWNRNLVETKLPVRGVFDKNGNIKFVEDISDDGIRKFPVRIIVKDALQHNRIIHPKQIWEKKGKGLGCELRLWAKEKEQHLEIEFIVKPKLQGKLWYFDGKRPYYNPQKRIERILFGGRKNRNVLPFISVHNSRRQVMIGLDPHTMVSFIHTIFEPADGTMQFIVRTVVPKREKRKLGFLILTSSAVYGFKEALQWYYDSTPDAFKLAPGLDNRMYLSAVEGEPYLYYKNLRHQGPYEEYYMETTRRFSAGWEWIFAGWPYAIEWSGESRWMKQFTKRFGNKKRLWDYQREDLALHDWRAGIVPCFYMSNFMEVHWKKRFSDSLITEGLCLNGSGCFGGWNFQRVYMGTDCSYGKFYNERLYQMLKYCQFGGISMDAFGGLGGWKYRGPNVNQIEGAAFDDKGVFVDEGVGLHQFYESLKKAGHTKEGGRYVITSTAGADTYHGAISIDVGLAEICVFRPHYYGLYFTRQMMGRKPITLYGSHVADELGRKLNWKDMSNEELVQLYRDLFDYTILAAVTFATPIDTDDLWGDVKGQRYQRAIVELAQLGYEPATGVRCNNPELWIRRYGCDVNSIITIADFSGESRRVKFKIDNRYVGLGRWIPINYWPNAEMSAELLPKYTLFDIKLKKRTPELIRLGCAIKKVDKQVKLQTKSKWVETDDGCKISIILSNISETDLEMKVYIPKKHIVKNVEVNGEDIPFSTKSSYVAFTLPEAKKADITIDYKSLIFKSPKSQLLNYPYVSDKGRGVTVVIPNISDYFIDKRSARRIVAFFRFWYREASKEGKYIEMPIVNEEMFGRVYKSGCIIKIKKGPMGIWFEKSSSGGNIIISGKTPQEREQAVLALLELLEKKYPFIGVMPYGRLLENGPTETYKMRKAKGLIGKPVPMGL